ncbi:chorismate-binding protein [Flavobacterium sp. Fl-318]|uniref:isochorismate synthase n=1 Tax=Flavobacterium cupriresistens TaxID=2893885 RepID=A0ABU4R8S4_9FLAO|nr:MULTISPECIES: chorismate-binding protein [unclassified Flavobacterium]MDX6187915.1 chorismate-binding protein [Flavobacterium sp. Fl-318]UFH42165.1 chorismate-binding protein [Flavobacterium sp. F-323]
MNNFFSKIKNHKAQNLPFVLYSKPNSNRIIGLLQQNNNLHTVSDFTEKGFVFASFDEKQLILIPENESEIITSEQESVEINLTEINDSGFDVAAKKQYEDLVAKGIEAIKNDEFKKVVLSRSESVDLAEFDFAVVFQQLIQLYPTTFCYCFFHPKVEFWMGATPEQLLKANGNEFETTALAGTQKANSEVEILWQQKEKEEQQYVTDFIIKRLREVALSVNVTEPYSIKAGSIWHIKTDISGVLNENSTLEEVIDTLHPTPAVCGLPKKKAKAFILENENYDRTFYTGFLGELNSSLASSAVSSDLFVNLRSMQIQENKAILYMGCGITKESIPEKEWEESVNKSMTMKRALSIKAV